MSKALKLFESTLDRATSIFVLAEHWHDHCEGTKDDAEHKPVYQDMARAGIVLGIAAMDEFFTRRFSELLVPFIRKEGVSKGLKAILIDAGLDVVGALELGMSDRPLRKIRAIVDNHLDRYTTQKHDAIDSLFAALGLPRLSSDAEKLAGRKTLRKSVGFLTERRHAIVHNGDHDKHGKIVPVNFKNTLKRLRDVGLYVKSADEIITNREGSL